MPRPRKLTDEQARAAHAAFKASPRRGRMAALAREYGVAWVTIDAAIRRVESESEFFDSRGTTQGGTP